MRRVEVSRLSLNNLLYGHRIVFALSAFLSQTRFVKREPLKVDMRLQVLHTAAMLVDESA